DALAVEVVLVPGHGGEQPLQGLFGGAGDHLGEGVAVFVGVFGEQARQVTFQGMRPLRTGEMDVEWLQEAGPSWQRLRRREGDASCSLHTWLDAPKPQRMP